MPIGGRKGWKNRKKQLLNNSPNEVNPQIKSPDRRIPTHALKQKATVIAHHPHPPGRTTSTIHHRSPWPGGNQTRTLPLTHRSVLTTTPCGRHTTSWSKPIRETSVSRKLRDQEHRISADNSRSGDTHTKHCDIADR